MRKIYILCTNFNLEKTVLNSKRLNLKIVLFTNRTSNKISNTTFTIKDSQFFLKSNKNTISDPIPENITITTKTIRSWLELVLQYKIRNFYVYKNCLMVFNSNINLSECQKYFFESKNLNLFKLKNIVNSNNKTLIENVCESSDYIKLVVSVNKINFDTKLTNILVILRLLFKQPDSLKLTFLTKLTNKLNSKTVNKNLLLNKNLLRNNNLLRLLLCLKYSITGKQSRLSQNWKQNFQLNRYLILNINNTNRTTILKRKYKSLNLQKPYNINLVDKDFYLNCFLFCRRLELNYFNSRLKLSIVKLKFCVSYKTKTKFELNYDKKLKIFDKFDDKKRANKVEFYIPDDIKLKLKENKYYKIYLNRICFKTPNCKKNKKAFSLKCKNFFYNKLL